VNARAVLVTGASSGIGAAVVSALSDRGFVVYAGVRSSEDATRLKASGVLVRPLLFDVTDAAAIAAAADVVCEANIPLVGLVNNAGIALGGPLETLPIDELRRQFDVNCFGALAVTQAFLPLLRRQRSRIVIVGSISGRFSVPYIAPYSASKFALRAFADALRIELRPSGIDVCLIEPGSVATPIWGKGRSMRKIMLARLNDSSPKYYRTAIESLMRASESEERGGMPVERVAGAVIRALTERIPRARRIIGAPARLGALLALLPPELHDRFLRAGMESAP
jgi:NAD(P)-dependent dehydrogenase (short-subunit alcohol dehydrogenase family)